MVAYVTGMVNQELLLRNEYLGAENRILRFRSRVDYCCQKVKGDIGGDRPAARTESLGRIGGGREAGYAAGLVPKADSLPVHTVIPTT
jgi:hypothetical protein